MKIPFARLPFGLLALSVAACGDEAAPVSEDDGREASGEVLEGTISDDMLPIEDLRSQAPLAEGESSEDGAETAAGSSPAEPAAEETSD